MSAVANPKYDADAMPSASQDKYGRTFDKLLQEPDPVYWRISSVLESILFVAEKHNIPVWAEYGTLLGLKRDRGVILWDYDADLAMWDKDRERLMECVALEQSKGTITPLLVMDINYYEDRGCMAAYLAKDESRKEFHKDDICDIIFNVLDGDMVKSLQSDEVLQAYPCAYNYMGHVSDVLPLRPDVLLGHRVWTWNNWQKCLDLTYGNWRKPLKDVSSWIVPAFHGPSTVSIPEVADADFKTFLELKKSKTPVILRQTQLLHTPEARFREALKKQQRKMFGYTSSIEWDLNEAPAEEFYDMFLQRKLPYNVVDAPVDDLSVLPDEWRQFVAEELGPNDANKGSLCWILTNAPCLTMWHTDPEFNNDGMHHGNPGGWMKLMEGRKIWWTLPKEHFAVLEARGHSVQSVAKLSLSELMKLENGYCWGKILVGEISGGDLLWFPAGCLHKVVTLEHSWGWGGYF